jgi:hypothetical protein
MQQRFQRVLFPMFQHHGDSLQVVVQGFLMLRPKRANGFVIVKVK